MSTFVVKIGGSMISKNIESLIDMPFLLHFKEIILNENAQSGNKFLLVAGGGAIMRKYRDILEGNNIIDKTNIHWVGTTVNVVHAMILKAIFGDSADAEVLKFEEYYQETPLEIQNVVKTGGGGRPGHSGDVDAVVAAKRLGAKIVYSLKNVDGVYEADPKLVPTAKRLEFLNWQEYLNIIGNPSEHTPGANFPIDPIASQMASQAGIKFVILGGQDLNNFMNAINGKNFIGTTVG